VAARIAARYLAVWRRQGAATSVRALRARRRPRPRPRTAAAVRAAL